VINSLLNSGLMINKILLAAVFTIVGALTATAPSATYSQQPQNSTAAAQNTTATTEGFGGPPTGPLTAVRHVFDDPSLRVWHFCKPNDKITMVCQLYDSSSPNATLIGIEYMITSDAYAQLPAREKSNWHYHKEEFAPDRADPKYPLLSQQQQNATLKKMEETYGKVILTWNPSDKGPVYPPQIIQVQHPFMVNTTVTPDTEKKTGTFNQTLFQ
jgi:Protein of unknown function (DUF1264)